MSAHSIEELREALGYLEEHKAHELKHWNMVSAALDELEALRAAKSEHKRTRREIRRLARFVQWEPASMVAEKENLLIENRMISENLIAITKERNGLLQANEKLTNTNRDHNDERNNTLFPRIKELCAENARLANKSNAYEDSYHAAKKAHATFTEAIAEALGVPEGETRSLVGVASELRRHADAANQRCSEAQAAAVALAGQCDELRKAKVTTNADVCAVEALEEKLAEAERQRGIAHRACIMNQDSYEASLASMRAECGRLQKRVDEVEEENARLIRIFDAVRALMVKS